MRRLCKRIEEKYINTDNFSCYSSISFLLAMELFFIYFIFFFHVAVSVVLSHFNQQMAAPTLLLYTCLYGAQQHRRVASVWRCRAKHTPPAKTVSQSSTSLLIFCWIKTRRCPCPYGRTIDQHHQSPPPPISFFTTMWDPCCFAWETPPPCLRDGVQDKDSFQRRLSPWLYRTSAFRNNQFNAYRRQCKVTFDCILTTQTASLWTKLGGKLMFR